MSPHKETPWVLDPRRWNVEQCCDELLESDKADDVDGLIWDLRGLVFRKLKELGKFAEDVEGPEAQPLVDIVMRALVGRI